MSDLNNLVRTRYRIVIDGNGYYRIQYAPVGLAIIGPETWYFEPDTFQTLEEAEKRIGNMIVKEIVKEY